MRPHCPRRPAYAMLLVLAFVLLFLALLGVAYRQMASALRVETVRSQQGVRDQGSIHALALALTLLETGQPPTSPYVCAVSVTTPAGQRSYTVTYTSQGGTDWLVSVAPTAAGDEPPPMPTIFLP